MSVRIQLIYCSVCRISLLDVLTYHACCLGKRVPIVVGVTSCGRNTCKSCGQFSSQRAKMPMFRETICRSHLSSSGQSTSDMHPPSEASQHACDVRPLEAQVTKTCQTIVFTLIARGAADHLFCYLSGSRGDRRIGKAERDFMTRVERPSASRIDFPCGNKFRLYSV